MAILSICATQSGTYTTLPTPVEMATTVNTLDSAKSGRDNNTGKMFRDKVAEKITAKVTFPYGMTKNELKDVLPIILGGSFWCKMFIPKTAQFKAVNVYCATCEANIAKVTAVNASGTPTDWIYDSFDLSFIEM